MNVEMSATLEGELFKEIVPRPTSPGFAGLCAHWKKSPACAAKGRGRVIVVYMV